MCEIIYTLRRKRDKMSTSKRRKFKELADFTDCVTSDAILSAFVLFLKCSSCMQSQPKAVQKMTKSTGDFVRSFFSKGKARYVK